MLNNTAAGVKYTVLQVQEIIDAEMMAAKQQAQDSTNDKREHPEADNEGANTVTPRTTPVHDERHAIRIWTQTDPYAQEDQQKIRYYHQQQQQQQEWKQQHQQQQQ